MLIFTTKHWSHTTKKAALVKIPKNRTHGCEILLQAVDVLPGFLRKNFMVALRQKGFT